MTEQIKNDIPQFVACGLEMGNCPRQIPYDMAEHERIIMTDLLDKVAEKLKAEVSICKNCMIVDCDTEYFKPMCEKADKGYFVEEVCELVDDVITEMKIEIEKGEEYEHQN